jgi:mannosyltransferase
MTETISPAAAGTHNKRTVTGLLAHSSIEYAALAGIILLALLLRFYKLGEWGFWIDEVLTVRRVTGDMSDVPRLSYHVIGWFLSWAGVSDWNARFIPAVAGVLSLPLIYFPTRRLLGPGVALLSVLLLALSPWHLYWSQNARFYTFLLIFYTLGVFAFFQWLETDRLRWLAAALLLLGLAVLERFNAAFFAPAAAAYVLILLLSAGAPFGRPSALRWRNLLLFAVPAVLFAAHQIIFAGMLSSLAEWIFGRSHNPLRVLLSVIYDLGLPLFLLALLGGVYLVLQRSRAGLYFFLSAVVPLLVLVALSPFTQSFSRYVFMTLPAWAILAAVAAREIYVQSTRSGRILALGLVLVLLADAASQNVLYYTTQNGNRENYKDAYALVEQRMQPGDWVVTTRAEIAEYYMGIQAVDSNRIDLDGIIASGRPAWFVMDNRTHISDRLQGWLRENTVIAGVYDVYIPGRPMEMRVYYWDGEG